MSEARFRRGGRTPPRRRQAHPASIRGFSAGVRLRRAARADLAGLSELESQVFTGDRLTPRQFAYHLENPSSDLIVARGGGELFGYALLFRRRGSERARIYSIAVSDAARGQGLGVRLLRRLESTARAHGAKEMRLEVRQDNVAALGLYERAGYRRFGEYLGYYEDGADAWRLEKRLRAARRR